MIRRRIGLFLILSLHICGARPASAQFAPRIEGGHDHVSGGFAQDFLQAISLSIQQDLLFGSKFLLDFQSHVNRIMIQCEPQEIKNYLMTHILGEQTPEINIEQWRASLGKKPMESRPAAALFLANALARQDESKDILAGMEKLKRGLGQRTSEILRNANGKGRANADFRAFVRSLGEWQSLEMPLTYDFRGNFDLLFDGKAPQSSSGHHIPKLPELSFDDGTPEETKQ